MVAEGSTPQRRVRAVLSSVSVAMSNVVLTSVLGIVTLSAAGSFANRSFFRSLFLIFLCIYLFRVLLLSAVLSVAAPQMAGRQTIKTQKSSAQFLSKKQPFLQASTRSLFMTTTNIQFTSKLKLKKSQITWKNLVEVKI